MKRRSFKKSPSTLGGFEDPSRPIHHRLQRRRSVPGRQARDALLWRAPPKSTADNYAPQTAVASTGKTVRAQKSPFMGSFVGHYREGAFHFISLNKQNLLPSFSLWTVERRKNKRFKVIQKLAKFKLGYSQERNSKEQARLEFAF